MAKRQQALAQVILKDPAVESLSSFIGVDGTNVTLNSGRILINLKPLAQRRVTASEVIRRLQSELATVQGITLFMQPVQDLTVEDRVSRTQYQYSLDDPNGAELNAWAPRLVDALRERPELQDVSSDQQDQGLGTAVFIDRGTASRLGVSPQTIDDTLYDAFGQRQVSTMFTQLNQYRVVLEVKPDFRQNPEDLHNIYVRGASSTQGVPLSAVTRVEETTAPLAITRQGQFPAVTLSFNLAPGVALGEAVGAIQTATRQLGLPASIQGSFQGIAQAFQASLANEPLLIAAALVAVYLVLGVLYESYIHPLTILSTLPSAGVGAVLALTVGPPLIPVGMPTELLERRPDIAAAERLVAAANAQISVAEAAFFPTITLSASGGLDTSNLTQWLTWPMRFWSIGPAISETVFDGGFRRAQTDAARAAYDANVASYRQTVLTGFQEVEDNLAALRILEAEAQDEAVKAAQESVTVTTNQYKAGTVNYLNVVTVQATALTNETTAVQILGRRMTAAVMLVKALGGSWNVSALPSAEEGNSVGKAR
jgi:hypothetical protein